MRARRQGAQGSKSRRSASPCGAPAERGAAAESRAPARRARGELVEASARQASMGQLAEPSAPQPLPVGSPVPPLPQDAASPRRDGCAPASALRAPAGALPPEATSAWGGGGGGRRHASPESSSGSSAAVAATGAGRCRLRPHRQLHDYRAAKSAGSYQNYDVQRFHPVNSSQFPVTNSIRSAFQQSPAMVLFLR